MSEGAIDWRVVDTPADVAAQAAQWILRAAEQAIARQGRFDLVLAGGTTPLATYRRLAFARADWLHWHLWLGDERCLPTADMSRNSRLISEIWLDACGFPAENRHFIPAEMGAQEAAARYARDLVSVALFDLVLLGLGEDGHIASLFPGQCLGEASGSPTVLSVSKAPKPPADRVTLSVSRLSSTRQVLVLVTGAGKRQAIERWQAGAVMPAACIRAQESVTVLMDRAASNS